MTLSIFPSAYLDIFFGDVSIEIFCLVFFIALLFFLLSNGDFSLYSEYKLFKINFLLIVHKIFLPFACSIIFDLLFDIKGFAFLGAIFL